IVCEYPKSREPHPAPQPAYIVVPQQTDMVHELTKYKNMLDQGLITEEDYERMKKQLLGI
ncbi:MAG: SHOCT domain-containing protein, partial [Clostridia bacterium]|nr:SHOCT domain-containing protein [Clostridia bacterium]